jgi:hypothetical protein
MPDAALVEDRAASGSSFEAELKTINGHVLPPEVRPAG